MLRVVRVLFQSALVRFDNIIYGAQLCAVAMVAQSVKRHELKFFEEV